MFKKVFLDYDFDIFINADYSRHFGSCLSYQKIEQEDIHKIAGGFPITYHEDNTRIRQLWWDQTQIDYEFLGEQTQMEVITVSSILQPPGNVVTLHKDTFYQINKKYPNDSRTKVRANIYLEDWKVGHFINYQDQNKEWKTSTHWKKGEGFLWNDQHHHLSANAGLQDKLTLQISGFYYG